MTGKLSTYLSLTLNSEKIGYLISANIIIELLLILKCLNDSEQNSRTISLSGLTAFNLYTENS